MTLTKHLQDIIAQKKGIFVPYIMAGDHPQGLDGLPETIAFLEKSGASTIEVGIPWSDPVADGPVIERAGQRSLARGVNLTQIIAKLQTIQTAIPLVIMTYLNPIFQYGIEQFVEEVSKSPVKGLIIPDLPYEHRELLLTYLQERDIALIPLISLTTGLERQKQLLKGAQGFIYAVAINGVTGKTTAYRTDLDEHLAQLRNLTDIPVLTGFGVSTKEDILRFNKVSDGVIVGSKIVRDLHEGRQQEVMDFVAFGAKVDK